MNGGCHCGRVTIEVPGKPDYLNRCNCTLCTKLGGTWAYYPRSQVRIDGETEAYVRADEPEPSLSTHFCGGCGCTTHWSPLSADAPDRMGVNMGCSIPPLRGIEVHYGNRRDDYDGERRYYRAPTIFDGLGVTA